MSDGKKITICPQPGCNVDLSKLMDVGKLLLEMGYSVTRKKIARPGQKTLLNAIEITEQPDEDTGGKGNVN